MIQTGDDSNGDNAVGIINYMDECCRWNEEVSQVLACLLMCREEILGLCRFRTHHEGSNSSSWIFALKASELNPLLCKALSALKYDEKIP
ncbi:hypothetical protein AVEN_188076-1 [Araneus ventricosus]|uniref:Uncharacterized protein n=1 Tax=Araneus ventricosus TaxID=182803 RepID=A0A4Y2IE02_ARAVE|nr:hypothetical protein AVEN_188076-1 [Araneus ventricosus]